MSDDRAAEVVAERAEQERVAGKDDNGAGSNERRRRGSGYGRSSEYSTGRPLEVVVDDRGFDYALRTFRKLISKEGLLRSLRRREHYEKPSQRRRRKSRDAMRRRRKQEARARRRDW